MGGGGIGFGWIIVVGIAVRGFAGGWSSSGLICFGKQIFKIFFIQDWFGRLDVSGRLSGILRCVARQSRNRNMAEKDDKDDKGIRCPRCGCRDMRDEETGLPVSVVSKSKWRVTKVMKGFGYIRRRRVCRNCGKVIFTKEKVEKQEGGETTER